MFSYDQRYRYPLMQEEIVDTAYIDKAMVTISPYTIYLA